MMLVGTTNFGYRGIPSLYIPFFRKKSRKFTRSAKKWNKDLSSIRALVEQAHKRDFAVLGTEFRGKKHNKKEMDFLSMIVRVVTSICNLKFQREPLRKTKRNIKSKAY